MIRSSVVFARKRMLKRLLSDIDLKETSYVKLS